MNAQVVKSKGEAKVHSSTRGKLSPALTRSNQFNLFFSFCFSQSVNSRKSDQRACGAEWAGQKTQPTHPISRLEADADLAAINLWEIEGVCDMYDELDGRIGGR